ncbi:hypothetical protein BGLA2_60079 [Burkholderia gladioli]|nr:hypothetical protein BGLA2_60079 [Burkholderia gladioli]
MRNKSRPMVLMGAMMSSLVKRRRILKAIVVPPGFAPAGPGRANRPPLPSHPRWKPASPGQALPTWHGSRMYHASYVSACTETLPITPGCSHENAGCG